MLGEQPDSSRIQLSAMAPRVLHTRKQDHTGAVFWLTGLPGSGKSTIALAAQAQLQLMGYRTVVLDGDRLRRGLSADLGFSAQDRNENVRRTAEVAKLFLDTGVIVLVALVSPLREARNKARHLFDAADFFEIYCQCPIEVCRERDPKGHYTKADSGLLKEFTGVASPYEAPLHPALILNTASQGIEHSTVQLIGLLQLHTNSGASLNSL